MTDTTYQQLVQGLNALARAARRNSVEHGFGAHGDRLRARLAENHSMASGSIAQEDYTAYLGNRFMLIAGEVAEAHEELRSGHAPNETYHRPDGKPEGVPAELADVLIRVFDTAQELGIDLEHAVAEKMAYNASRPRMHGRKF